jgi:PAS domain S-box-containing protein
MIEEYQPVNDLLEEIKRLRRELAEANNIIDAIRHGEVDALLVSDEQEDQVYILKGADHVYRVLVEEMQEGFATIASNGTILFCNKNFADILKAPLEQVIGSSIYNLLKPQDRETFTAFLSEGKGSLKKQCSFKTGAGYCATVAATASSITVEGDILICLVVTDLTELRRSERLIQMIFEQAKEPIIACDRFGLIVQANPAATTMFGGLLAGNYFDEVIPFFLAADCTRFRLTRAIDNSSSYGVEVQYTQLDGKQLTLLVNASRFDDEDNLTGCVVMLTDITHKRLLADELARLDRLNIVGEMAAGIGHEVRNPLTTVRGYLQMFQLRSKYRDDHEQLKIMIEELDRANSIITEFLSLAKNKSVDLKPGNLNGTIHALFPLLRADAFRLGHEMQADVGDIPVVYYDDKEIRQLILNLVRNGMDAMDSGGVITIKTYAEIDKVVLAVEDTGSGIPKEIMNKLGTPFVTTKESGTGLGLSICYRIAERHGAKIEFKSSSKGTTFFVKFKIHNAGF